MPELNANVQDNFYYSGIWNGKGEASLLCCLWKHVRVICDYFHDPENQRGLCSIAFNQPWHNNSLLYFLLSYLILLWNVLVFFIHLISFRLLRMTREESEFKNQKKGHFMSLESISMSSLMIVKEKHGCLKFVLKLCVK